MPYFQFLRDFERQTKVQPMKAMAEGVATVISLATRNILKCKKQMLEDVTMISGEDTACMLTKHKIHVLYFTFECSSH